MEATGAQITIAVAAIATAIIISLSWITTLLMSKRTLSQQSFIDLQKQYREPLMAGAIMALQNTLRGRGIESMKKDYEADLKRWEGRGHNIGLEKDLYNSLHIQRRLVSHFYHQMEDLYIYRVIKPKVLFRIWKLSALKIIDEIIIPLEDLIRERYEESKPGDVPVLRKLYTASKLSTDGKCARLRQVNKYLKSQSQG